MSSLEIIKHADAYWALNSQIEKKAKVTNIASLEDNNVLISMAHNQRSLFKYKYDTYFTLTNGPEHLLAPFTGVDIKCCLCYKQYLLCAPYQKFEILYNTLGTTQIEKLLFLDKSIDLHSKIYEFITNSKQCRSCLHKDCYHLVGLVNSVSSIVIIIQSSCSENKQNRILYLIKCPIVSIQQNEQNKIFLENNLLSLEGIYDLYMTAITNHISHNKATHLYVSSVTATESGDLYIVIVYGDGGFILTIKKFKSIDMYGQTSKITMDHSCNTPLHILNRPRGVASLNNDTLIVIHDYSQSNKPSMFSYSILKIRN
jgi:hypothetical protein